jgi:methyl-accepting chemotaxis protein
LLKEIEEPHRRLHQSGLEINKVLKKEHPGLLLTLYQRLNDHVNWADSTVKVKELVAEIAAASNEQALGVEQINKAVEEMNSVTQQVAANAEESASASE